MLRLNLRKRFQAWFESRLPLRDSTTLTQRNVYILPTRPGFMLAATLLVLLIASINYQLNLGYILTFLLTGSMVSGWQFWAQIIGAGPMSNRKAVRRSKLPSNPNAGAFTGCLH